MTRLWVYEEETRSLSIQQKVSHLPKLSGAPRPCGQRAEERNQPAAVEPAVVFWALRQSRLPECEIIFLFLAVHLMFCPS